jgi:hypothetical protein
MTVEIKLATRTTPQTSTVALKRLCIYSGVEFGKFRKERRITPTVPNGRGKSITFA